MPPSQWLPCRGAQTPSPALPYALDLGLVLVRGSPVVDADLVSRLCYLTLPGAAV